MSTPEQSLAPIERATPAPISMGARGVELRSLEDLFRFAKAVANTPFAPRDFKTPEAIMIACQYGMEVGLTPMQSLQSIAVVNGKPSLYGDGLLGVVLASGLVEDFEERIEGEGDAAVAICRVKRRGVATVCERSFSVADAKKAGLWGKQGPWTNYSQRMQAMRARSWALRDLFSDVTRGMIAVEEAQDIPAPSHEPRNVTPIRPEREESTPDGPQISKKSVVAILSAAATTTPRMDAQALAVEFYGRTLDTISASEGDELLGYLQARRDGEVPPAKHKPMTVAEQTARLAKVNPAFAAVFEAQAPRETPDAVEADGVPSEIVAEFEEAVARDDEREKPARETEDEREQLLARLKSLRADEASMAPAGYKQPELTARTVKASTNSRLAELVAETCERIRLIEEL